MSVKYERFKKRDAHWPILLRMLSRLFSRITFAVVLLTLVIFYGTLASVPIAYLAKGAIYFFVGVIFLGGALMLAYRIYTGQLFAGCISAKQCPWLARCWHAAKAIVTLLLGFLLSFFFWHEINIYTANQPWFLEHQATVIYRLPFFEMTELEFYSWWPFKLILLLFVCNMIWATLTRIEFKWLNIGVLTVHTGIVAVALGSVFYGNAKREGDLALWRKDLGGKPAKVFYDATNPAIYFSLANRHVMIPLNQLPRYNDYPPPSITGPATASTLSSSTLKLSIKLHDKQGFKEVLGDQLRATVSGFYAYGSLKPTWIDAARKGDVDNLMPNLAMRVAIGNEHGVKGAGGKNNSSDKDEMANENSVGSAVSKVLVAAIPAERYVQDSGFGLEYLVAPSSKRLADLLVEFRGKHGLIVEVPSQKFRQVYSIHAGQKISLGQTGYTLTLEKIGPYTIPFATQGYRGATDTCAIVRVQKKGRLFRRIVMHRFPERSQDFVPMPNDSTVGPMGKRMAPSLEIRLVYIDATLPQFRLIDPMPVVNRFDFASNRFNGNKALPIVKQRAFSKTQLIVRMANKKPIVALLGQDKFPIGRDAKQDYWLYITQRLTHATRAIVPVVTPLNQRKPSDEGTYIHALVPVDLEMDLPNQKTPWRHRIWLGHMRYPDAKYATDLRRSQVVNVPNLGNVSALFSRERIVLPFEVQLNDFQMISYPGTEIPRDYIAQLELKNNDGQVVLGEAKLNNPLLYHGMKLSQTGWDPGNPRQANNKDKNAQGKYINQQRYTILSVGNNVGIHVVFVGACLIVMGIPWAFYIKPMMQQRRKKMIQRELINVT